jgi:chemotaxis protein CheD
METGLRRELVVKMAELTVVENSTLLKTTLGSCVAVILHDGNKKIGGLAHIVLPRPLGSDTSVGKYAATAVPALLSRLLKRGGNRNDVRACVVGGANMFKLSSDRRIATVGEKNIEATKQILRELGIPIAFEDTGGEQGKTVLFDNHTGEITVRTLRKVAWKGEKD